MTEDTFEQIFKKYHKPLIYFASRYVGEMYAEDVVSEVMVHIWDIGMDDVVNEKQFLYKCVYNSCMTALKYDKRAQRKTLKLQDYFTQSGDYEPADNLIIRAELITLISKKIEEMPPQQRKVFDLMYLHQLSYSEISAYLGLSKSAIGTYRRRFLDNFKIFGTPILSKKYWASDGPNAKPILKTCQMEENRLKRLKYNS